MTDRDADNPIIRLVHVHHTYGRITALADLNFDIAKNEWVFISGPSGAGKTTLLKLLYFGTRASAGEGAGSHVHRDDTLACPGPGRPASTTAPEW